MHRRAQPARSLFCGFNPDAIRTCTSTTGPGNTAYRVGRLQGTPPTGNAAYRERHLQGTPAPGKPGSREHWSRKSQLQGKPPPGKAASRERLLRGSTGRLWKTRIQFGSCGLEDFLLGVGLRPSGTSLKAAGGNYIREHVYVAHSAFFFLPRKRVIIHLHLTSERVGGGFFPSLASGRGGGGGPGRAQLLARCELPLGRAAMFESSVER